MGDIWFTSDQQFGWARGAELCGRPHADPDDMNAYMIDEWNSRVDPGDTVWVLGDFAMGQIRETVPLAGLLTGRKYLVAGNHDRPFHGVTPDAKKRAEWVDFYKECGFTAVVTGAAYAEHGIPIQIPIGGGLDPVWLSHFPVTGESRPEQPDRYPEYRPRELKRGRRPWILCGHVHTMWDVRDRHINVGVDVRDYAPMHIDQVRGIIRANHG